MRTRRSKDRAMAALAGGGVALVVLSTPVGLMEMMITSAGISEMLPAAAPPLGFAARLLIAAFAGLMALGIAWSFTGKAKERALVDGRAKGDRKMGFALSKLTALARGRSTPGRSAHPAPALRRADAHPDAPARAPIFASRDFEGLDIFAPAAPEPRRMNQSDTPTSVMVDEPAELVIQPAAGLDMPRSPEPLAEVELPPVPAFTAKSPVLSGPGFTPSFAPASEREEAAEPSETIDLRPLSSLSITELTQRLERGLTQRGAPSTPRVLADMPVAEAVMVRPIVERDLDDALRAALGTLRTLATRTG